jgi:PAS domain S-box-containing protein
MRVDMAGVAGPTPAAGDYAYRALAEHLPDVAVFVFDQDLRYELATGAGLPKSAWSAEQIVGRTVFELFPPERAELLAARYRAALTGERVRFEVVGSRGQPDHIWTVDVVPMCDQDGVVTGGMAVARDVTEQRRAEEKQRQAEQELRASHRQLLDAQRIARVGSFEWELATGRLTMSQEVYRILGLDPETPLSLEEAVALVHPDDLPAMRALLDRLACDPAPYEIEFRILRADGSWRTVLARGEGVCDDTGRVVRVIATDQDITEAKQAEEERRRLLARLYEVLEGQHQRLAADLHDSHVQTQAAIGLKLDQARLRLGPTTVAATRALLDELRDDVAAEVAALRRTIGALRPLVLDQRGLAAAIGELAAATRVRAALAACTVTDGLDGERLDPGVEAVLFRVAQQALANVEQHAAARHVRLRLEWSGPWVVLGVDDDGCGFEPSHVEVLPGHQGFGLTSMRERVQAIGGQLTVASRLGRGTRVQARVPAEPDP